LTAYPATHTASTPTGRERRHHNATPPDQRRSHPHSGPRQPGQQIRHMPGTAGPRPGHLQRRHQHDQQHIPGARPPPARRPPAHPAPQDHTARVRAR
jgi:hypothetical protein